MEAANSVYTIYNAEGFAAHKLGSEVSQGNLKRRGWTEIEECVSIGHVYGCLGYYGYGGGEEDKSTLGYE